MKQKEICKFFLKIKILTIQTNVQMTKKRNFGQIVFSKKIQTNVQIKKIWKNNRYLKKKY